MITIQLTDLEFFAHHGVFEEEQILGNLFTVNVVLKYEPLHLPITQIEDTINYENVFQLVEIHMKQPVALLETLASTMVIALRYSFSQLRFVSVSITKRKPPVKGWNGDVTVSCHWPS